MRIREFREKLFFDFWVVSHIKTIPNDALSTNMPFFCKKKSFFFEILALFKKKIKIFFRFLGRVAYQTTPNDVLSINIPNFFSKIDVFGSFGTFPKKSKKWFFDFGACIVAASFASLWPLAIVLVLVLLRVSGK